MGKLSPSERLLNLAKAAALVVPLFGAGVFAGNSKTVQHWIHGEPLPELEGQIDPLIGEAIHPEVRQKIETIIGELEAIKNEQKRIASKSYRDDSKIAKRVADIEKLVN